jgi:hypothetical protein
LISSDFYLFPTFKEFLCVRHFKSDDEGKGAIKEWLNGLAAEVYDESTQKPVTGFDICLKVTVDL